MALKRMHNTEADAFFKSLATPQENRGMSILRRYVKRFESARHSASCGSLILENSIEYDIRGRHHLELMFSLTYTQSIGASSHFAYFDELNLEFSHEFGEAYKGFSSPELIKETDFGKGSHSQTFRRECTLNLSRSLTRLEYEDLQETYRRWSHD